MNKFEDMENEVKEPVPVFNYIFLEEYLVSEETFTDKHKYFISEVFSSPKFL
jgi:hypothetical protein